MKTLLLILSIVVLLVFYSCLVMASRCSRDEESEAE
jgi:hypothetical protein